MSNKHIELRYEVQVQPTDSDVWYLSGRFDTFEDAELQAQTSANDNRPVFRAFRIVEVETVSTVLPKEYLVVHHAELPL